MKKEGVVKKKQIVLVEDEPTLTNLIESGLRDRGYEVKAAKDGKEGLRLIRETKPDLVLLDVMLPGLKGFDILEKLHKEDGVLPGLPVIIISNSGDPIEIERALHLGVRDYLVKVNFNPNEVVEKVNSVFEAEDDKGKKTRVKPKAVKGNQVLLVEDDTILSDALERKFVEKKYVVFKAFNANMARKVLQEHEVDIILLDLVLPDEHGLSFLRQLKKNERAKRIPVIIISNLGQQEEIDEGLRAGAVDYIVKTNTVPSEIFEKVKALIQKGQTRDTK
ncbi:MAG: response regulator [bacterium]|nr:response regulator [bacterium]